MAGKYPTGTTCVVCGSKVYARYRCRPHYLKWYRNQKNIKAARLFIDNRGRLCSYCDEPAEAKGFCGIHYDVVYKLDRSGKYAVITGGFSPVSAGVRPRSH